MPRTLRGRFIGPRADFHSEFAVVRPSAAASASQSAKVWLDGGRVLLVYRYVASDALPIGRAVGLAGQYHGPPESREGNLAPLRAGRSAPVARPPHRRRRR